MPIRDGFVSPSALEVVLRKPKVVVEVAPANNWAIWDELQQESLATDDTYVCLFDSTVVNGTDTGMGGGLTGSDLDYTAKSTVSAASGGKRTCSAAGGLQNQACWTNFMSGKTVFTRIAKVGNIARVNGYLSYRGGSGKPNWRCNAGVITTAAGTVSAAFPSTGTFYLCEFSDGVNGYVGWTTTRPTKLSDIPADQRITDTPANVASSQFYSSYHQLLGQDSGTGDLYYEVWSKACLIDTKS